jgi:hypothetical protein
MAKNNSNVQLFGQMLITLTMFTQGIQTRGNLSELDSGDFTVR